MIRKILFTLAIGLILPLQLSAETKEENAKRAKEILRKARKQEEKGIVKTSIKSIKNNGIISLKMKTIQYSKISNDGMPYSLIKTYMQNAIGEDLLQEINIINETGIWSVINGYAVKRPASNSNSKQKKVTTNKKLYNIKVESKNIDNKKYFLITEKMTNEYLKTFKLKFKGRPIYSYLTEFLIGQNDYIIYSIKKFTDKGVLNSKKEYKDIKLGKLDDGIFKLSKDLKIKKPRNNKEYFKLKDKIEKENFDLEKMMKFMTKKNKKK